MKKNLFALLAGIAFGFGLAISQMINQKKVIGFLDLFGNWDPSLALVMGGAVGVTALLFRFVLRRPNPIFEDKFYIPEKNNIDAPLFIGSALFGIGWGLAGFCPGPVFASLSIGRIEPVLFILALVAGSLAAKYLVPAKYTR
ncbi:MAG: hypothetical protein RL020_1428 [Pseudomonadota bacterium]|jgi:uncharacterized protein